MSDIAIVFKALADETRLRVLKLLAGGELCVCEIAAALAMEQPRLSFHLRILKQAGIVSVRRRERWILYRLNDADLFVRFLLLSIDEKFPAPEGGEARLDRKRLAAFGGREQACRTRGKGRKEK